MLSLIELFAKFSVVSIVLAEAILTLIEREKNVSYVGFTLIELLVVIAIIAFLGKILKIPILIPRKSEEFSMQQ